MIVGLDDLKKIREDNKDKKIVVGIGTFDLFHYEHLRYLNDAKKLGDVLVVIVKSNFLANKKSLDKPIIDEEQRIQIIDNLKCVDYTILASEEIFNETLREVNFDYDEKTNTWLCSFYKFFEMLKPDILYHENTTELNLGRQIISNEFKVKLIERERAALITTTKIIEKIKKL